MPYDYSYHKTETGAEILLIYPWLGNTARRVRIEYIPAEADGLPAETVITWGGIGAASGVDALKFAAALELAKAIASAAKQRTLQAVALGYIADRAFTDVRPWPADAKPRDSRTIWRAWGQRFIVDVRSANAGGLPNDITRYLIAHVTHNPPQLWPWAFTDAQGIPLTFSGWTLAVLGGDSWRFNDINGLGAESLEQFIRWARPPLDDQAEG